MPTDTALLSELLKAMSELSHELSDNGPNSLTNAKRIDLATNAEKLAIAAREPAENLYFQATQVRLFCNQVSARLTHICRSDSSEFVHQNRYQYGVFEAIPAHGTSVTVAELARQLHVNEKLLGKSKAQKSL